MENIFRKISIFRKCYFQERIIFSGVWLHSKIFFGKYFLVFGCILENALKNPILSCFLHFLAFSQVPNKYIITPTKSKFIKTQILNTQQKKFHQIRDQFGSENNKIRTTHATRGGLTQSKQIGDSAGRSWVWRMVRLGFATIGDGWVWWWTSSTIWGMGSTDEIDDLRNGFDGRARRSEKWVRDLTIWALLDERARSWVF